jgi:broad specificity phosphatase PhoE
MVAVVLIRHGQTAWSLAGRHTSVTDQELTEDGRAQARRLAAALAGRRFAAVLVSPRRRAVATAELAGLQPSIVDDDLVEWDYGEYEGQTTDEIRARRSDWSLWTDGCPGGESPEAVAARAARVLDRVRAYLPGGGPGGDVALVGHGHCLRAIATSWIGQPVRTGERLRLDPATLSSLGYERTTPVILSWNCSV